MLVADHRQFAASVARSAVARALTVKDARDDALDAALTGATLQIICDGEVLEDYDNPVPDLPSGLSTREFLHHVLGEPEA